MTMRVLRPFLIIALAGTLTSLPGLFATTTAGVVAETPVPTAQELEVLRELHARTNRAHSEAA